jgi:hypothetical protein
MMTLKTAMVVFAVAGMTCPLSAFAVLGGDAASVEADRASMGGSDMGTTAGAGYTVREIQAASGTAIKEYLSPSGTVFAISWSGPALPDLRQLLGSQFDVYTRAAAAQNTGPGRINVQDSGLVVQSGGQMRAFFGRAYLPAQVPQGVALDDIR